MMMMQMGQKPSQKKINQMMTMMNKNMNQKCKVHRHYINECYRNLSNNCSALFYYY